MPLPPSLCALLPACLLTYTKSLAYRGTPLQIKVCLTLVPGLVPLPSQYSRLCAVRKAYKKRALETHPDRVPPEEKEIAAEEFRKVTLIYATLLTLLIRDVF